MKCPRLDHFVRLQPDGKFGKCGHMIGAKEFADINDMQNSAWLKELKEQMYNDCWPKECVRCEMTEKTSNTSIRLDMIERDKILGAIQKDYLIVGGVLDNICNSACQSCNAGLSTKIGSLKNKDYKKINNFDRFFQLPQNRIVELDVNGGEPTASPNYKKLLKNLPKSVKIIRINTNGSRVIPEVVSLLEHGMRVIITLSFDGTGTVHDYARWPINWNEYRKNVSKYLELRSRYKNLRLNFWTTVTCLNVGDLDNIVQYASDNKIDHAYGFCITPTELDVRYSNKLTVGAKEKLSTSANTLLQSIGTTCASLKNNSADLKQFVQSQDALRKISFTDYFNFDLNLL
jgi:sulfatase maturation enzyme AslB (radical SAM superfamily)